MSEPTESVWNGLLRRAAALRRRYDGPTVPQSTWSLVNRAAQRFGDGALPAARDDDHFWGQWTLAMHSVLRDLRRRQKTRDAHGVGAIQPLHDQLIDEGSQAQDLVEDAEVLAELDAVLHELAQQDQALARIIAARYFEERTWNELADELDVSAAAVRRSCDLARAWMRRELGRRGVALAGDDREAS